MNYLSHFFIDQIPEQHYYNAALILPDISKRWIKKIEASMIPEQAGINQHELLKGAIQHYHSDHRFHTSAFFTRYQNIINEHLKAVPFSEHFNRKWFIAHVMLELLIDRQIVREYPQVVDSFYESLDRVSDQELSLFLASCGLYNSSDFIGFFDRFRNSKYIYYYADNNKFLYSLGRIMMRVGINEPNEKDSELLMDAFLAIEKKYMTPADTILKELKTVFN